MDHKYNTLIKILDRLANEAPKSYKTYHPNESDDQGKIKARSLAFIHLLLKVRFGLTDFIERHQHITDGTQDGGLDAYFIDHERKNLFFIQSKFRNSSQNFDSRSISAEELLSIEISRITKGSEIDSRGNPFNDKIKDFQSKLREIRDIAKYDFIVIFLGNIYKYTDEQIRRTIDNNYYQIIDSTTAYEELIFPLATGTYYDPDEIEIRLDIHRKESTRLKQEIETDFGEFEVNVIFVPTSEIGRVLLQYKNAILKYNPRNFLSLRKGGVNIKIKESIMEQEKNNFAILNNGITVLSDNFRFSDSTGIQNEGQIILTKPQILNGGQTAYTLSSIYKEFMNKSDNPLDGKEVLLKVITPISVENQVDKKFIELISNATNQQNEVSEADRRSNHRIQIELQKNIFNEYGYFYERKSGEFYDGINEEIINKNLIINRLDFIKAYWAYLGEPAAARRSSETTIFREDRFYDLLHSTEKYHEMFFAYMLFNTMVKIENNFPSRYDTLEKYGYSLLYGKWAVIASIGIQNPIVKKDRKLIFSQATEMVNNRLKDWKKFDDFVKKKNSDTKYFKAGESNYELYYKINRLDDDVREYFLR